MKPIIFSLLFMGLAISGCTNSATNSLEISCKMKRIPGRATLCSKIVSMNFGPADQFIGYSTVNGQILSILNEELAESVFSIKIENRRTYIKNIDEIVSNPKVMSYQSGSQGEVSLSINPGSYVMCTQSKRDASNNQAILVCEPADFRIDHPYQLLIIDNPRAGIQFEWK